MTPAIITPAAATPTTIPTISYCLSKREEGRMIREVRREEQEKKEERKHIGYSSFISTWMFCIAIGARVIFVVVRFIE